MASAAGLMFWFLIGKHQSLKMLAKEAVGISKEALSKIRQHNRTLCTNSVTNSSVTQYKI
jgi:hypothetical protein